MSSPTRTRNPVFFDRFLAETLFVKNRVSLERLLAEALFRQLETRFFLTASSLRYFFAKNRVSDFEGSPAGKRLYVRMQIIMGDPEQLLLLGQYDDEQLAQALLDRYYAPLHYLAYSLLNDTAAAEDIVQETLLVALAKIEQFQPGTDLKAWLCRIAIYRCRDVMRRRKIRDKWHDVWSRVAILGSPPRTPEEHTADRELRGELWQAVDDLGAKHRLPIIFFYIHGLTAPEIAEILDIREGTVYSRLHYGCRKLAGQFSNSHLELWAEELTNE